MDRVRCIFIEFSIIKEFTHFLLNHQFAVHQNWQNDGWQQYIYSSEKEKVILDLNHTIKESQYLFLRCVYMEYKYIHPVTVTDL